jgi:hypothetical protein
MNEQFKISIRFYKYRELASLVISLREEDKLAIVNEDEQPNKEPQIICSMELEN